MHAVESTPMLNPIKPSLLHILADRYTIKIPHYLRDICTANLRAQRNAVVFKGFIRQVPPSSVCSSKRPSGG